MSEFLFLAKTYLPYLKYLGIILDSNLTFNEHDTLTFVPYLYSVSDKQS